MRKCRMLNAECRMLGLTRIALVVDALPVLLPPPGTSPLVFVHTTGLSRQRHARPRGLHCFSRAGSHGLLRASGEATIERLLLNAER